MRERQPPFSRGAGGISLELSFPSEWGNGGLSEVETHPTVSVSIQLVSPASGEGFDCNPYLERCPEAVCEGVRFRSNTPTQSAFIKSLKALLGKGARGFAKLRGFSAFPHPLALG